jgi:hypothetical protein
MGKVIVDLTCERGGAAAPPTLLNLNNQVNMDDVVTSQVGTPHPVRRHFGKPAEGLTMTPLATLQELMPVDLIATCRASLPRAATTSGEEMPLAIRLSGVPLGVLTAGRNRRPPGRRMRRRTTRRRRPAHLSKSAADNSIVLAADADTLGRRAAVEAGHIRQRVIVPRNGNLAFAQGWGAVPGDNALITPEPRLVQPAAPLIRDGGPRPAEYSAGS